MHKVDFITFTWRGDVEKLAAPDELRRRMESHGHAFNKKILIKQRLRDQPDFQYDFPEVDIIAESEDHPTILEEFGIEPEQPIADEKTHGPTALHYWKWHVINHLIGLKVSDADFILFSDADCRIHSQPASENWVDKAIEVLRHHNDALIVGPSDGGTMAERRVGGLRFTRNVSQQMFICNRLRLASIDFDVPWNWEFTAPGGPMQEYYYMLEGRLWRYMHHNNLWRVILPAQWRYWHDQW